MENNRLVLLVLLVLLVVQLPPDVQLPPTTPLCGTVMLAACSTFDGSAAIHERDEQSKALCRRFPERFQSGKEVRTS